MGIPLFEVLLVLRYTIQDIGQAMTMNLLILIGLARESAPIMPIGRLDLPKVDL